MASTLIDQVEETAKIRVLPLDACDPASISQIVNIDLMTFSEPTWSRSTAGLMIRQGRTFLMTRGPVVIGTCQCLRSWERPQEAVLFMMAIRPGYRHQGMGTLFLQGVIEHLRGSGFRSVVLDVRESNKAAIRLYEQKFGFAEIGRNPDLYRKGESMVQMRMLLQSDEIAPVVFPAEIEG